MTHRRQWVNIAVLISIILFLSVVRVRAQSLFNSSDTLRSEIRAAKLDSARVEWLRACCYGHASRLVESNDLLSALPWLTALTATETGDKRTPHLDSLRLSYVLDDLPQLVAILPTGRDIGYFQINNEGTAVGAVVGDRDRGYSIQVWDLKSFREIGAPVPVPDGTKQLDITVPHHRLLIATKNTVRVVDLVTGSDAFQPLPFEDLGSATFSLDGTRIIVTDRVMPKERLPDEKLPSRRQISIWDSNTGKAVASAWSASWIYPDCRRGIRVANNCLRIVDPVANTSIGSAVSIARMTNDGAEPVSSVSTSFASAAPKLLTTCWNDNTQSTQFRLRDTATLKPLTDPLSFRHSIRFYDMDPTGTRLAIAARSDDEPQEQLLLRDSQQLLYTIDFARWNELPSPLHIPGRIEDCYLGAGGNLLAVSSHADHRMIEVFSLHDAASSSKSVLKLRGERMRFIANQSRLLVSGAHVGEFEVWDFENLKRPSSAHGELSDDGTRRCVYFDHNAQVYDVDSNKPIGGSISFGHSDSGFCSPSGKLFLSFEFSEGKSFAVLTEIARSPTSPQKVAIPDTLNSVAWDERHNRAIVTVGDKCSLGFRTGQAFVLELRPLRISAQTPGHARPLSFVEVAPDGGSFITCAGDGHAQMWDIHGQKLGPPLVHNKTHRSVDHAAFSADGRYIATSDEDGEAVLWDPTTCAELWRVGHVDRWRELPFAGVACCFSPDGKCMMTTGNFRARVWDLIHRVPLGPPFDRPYINGRYRTDFMGFASESNAVMVSNREGEEQLWELSDGRFLSMTYYNGNVPKTQRGDVLRFFSGKRAIASRTPATTLWTFDCQANYATLLTMKRVDFTGNLVVAEDDPFTRAKWLKELHRRAHDGHPRD